MESENIGDGSSASIQLSGPQAELLTKLEQLFTCLVTLDATINMQTQPEFRARIHSLCVRAPEVARHFAATILEFSNVGAIQTARKSISKAPSYSSARIAG
ncbi:hypothetical protein V8E54_012667 [Elaphomyces granulatus]